MDSEEFLPADGGSRNFNPSSNGSLCARRILHSPLNPYKRPPLGTYAGKPIVLSALQDIETRK